MKVTRRGFAPRIPPRSPRSPRGIEARALPRLLGERRGRTPWLLLGSLVVLMLAATVSWTRWRSAAGAAPAVRPLADLGRKAQPRPEATEATQAVREESATKTAEEFLAEYWGDAWPQVREALIAKGKDLDQPFSPQPWEEVEDALRDELTRLSEDEVAGYEGAYVAWPQEPTVEWVEQTYHPQAPVDAFDLAEIERIAEPFVEEARRQFGEFVSSLEAALRTEWDQGRYLRAPMTTTGAPRRDDRPAFFGTAGGAGGWAAGIALMKEDYPEIHGLTQSMLDLRRRRDQAIRRYLARR